LPETGRIAHLFNELTLLFFILPAGGLFYTALADRRFQPDCHKISAWKSKSSKIKSLSAVISALTTSLCCTGVIKKVGSEEC
jgi:hypothetical protein